MRREQKKQVQDFAELLSQAHEEIRKEIQNRNPAAAMDLLAQCQEGAIQLGSLIEAAEGEGAPTISLLESYCELAYEIYEELGRWSGLPVDAESSDRADVRGPQIVEAAFSKSEEAEREAREEEAARERTGNGEKFETRERAGNKEKPEAREEAVVAEGTVNGAKVYKKLRNALLRIESSIRNDIKVRLEVVFFPYKASMWDSLESVWQAAAEDPNCDAYVVPIPYYDRNSDGSLGTYHYEGNDFPSDVPVVYYENYRLEERKPDIVYIHNPYDEGNYVTTVDPRFYSGELKKHVNKLVYIPYYTTTGGMAESQLRCFAYYNADYIVIQAEKYRKFFAPELPEKKFLAFGSPKFDRVIRMCAQPGPLPEAWKDRMEGRKVYFYNTSINGLLADTPRFLKKMAYVFRCFQGREDACLLWRPHPLLESTLDSLRPELRPVYDKMKRFFMEKGIGIYDDTPDITETISHCDVYLGDSATSVTSLFGMAGKPLFVFNNYIDSAPEEGDWRGEIVRGFQIDGQDRWLITQGNKLYHSPQNDYRFQYYCDLSEYSSGNYYCRVLEVGGKVYACPANAQDILVVGGRRIQKRIRLERCLEQYGAFAMAWNIGRYLFLVPMQYPAVVRYDTERDRIDYIRGYNDVFVDFANGIWRVGGSCVWKDFLLLASPVDDRILAIDSKTGKAGLLTTGVEDSGGCAGLFPDGEDLWLLPYFGRKVTRWNPESGEARVYDSLPEGFRCRELPKGCESSERPFSGIAFGERFVYLSPGWGNMILRLDRESGEIQEWKPGFPMPEKEKNGYFIFGGRGVFLQRAEKTFHAAGPDVLSINKMPAEAIGSDALSRNEMSAEAKGSDTLSTDEMSAGAIGPDIMCTETEETGKWTYRYFSMLDRKLYDVNPDTGEYREIEVVFDKKELQEHAAGFSEGSDWMQYSCDEGAFHSLENLLDGNISGNAFDKARQLRAYEKIAANSDGTCGQKVHAFLCRSLGL